MNQDAERDFLECLQTLYSSGGPTAECLLVADTTIKQVATYLGVTEDKALSIMRAYLESSCSEEGT